MRVKKAKWRKVQPERFLIEMLYTSTSGADCNPPCATARSFTNKVYQTLCGDKARVNRTFHDLDVNLDQTCAAGVAITEC